MVCELFIPLCVLVGFCESPFSFVDEKPFVVLKAVKDCINLEDCVGVVAFEDDDWTTVDCVIVVFVECKEFADGTAVLVLSGNVDVDVLSGIDRLRFSFVDEERFVV